MSEYYLCRGKRLDNGNWIEGYLIAYSDGDAFICREDHTPDYLTKYEVDPATVGRCTGMKDKNGNKIWEGDRFLTFKGEEYEREYTVKFEKGCFVLVDKADWDFLQTNTSAGEVIGNIHDNPELLGGGEDG